MAINEKEARELVIKAGLELIKEKLIARTWGNISARVSPTEFVITPSGRAYESLKPEDLVKVKIEDLSYEGDIKPSSEKGIHAEAYKARNDVDFIVHTHQPYATAISLETKGQTFAPIAKYGLPGTKKLKKNFVKSLTNNPDKSCFLLERHGVVCLGKDYDDAFKKAQELELLSKQHFETHLSSKSNKVKPYLDDYAQMKGFGKSIEGEDAEAIKLIEEKNTLAIQYVEKAKKMNFFDVWIQHTVYKMKYSKLKDKK